MALRVLSLFAGIGGFDLGLERTGGFKTVAFCEIDPFCRRVLAKHWPEVPCYEDVRTLTAERLRADGIAVDVICGGFPCQDISFAGKGAGLEGERSGLWSEITRMVGELRPKYVIVENVSALLGRGVYRVLGDLASLGFDAEWHCIPASAVGLPHRRDRIWIVAHAVSDGCERLSQGRKACEQDGREFQGRQARRTHIAPMLADALRGQLSLGGKAGRMGRSESIQGNGPRQIASEPFVRRGDHGISNRSHRLRSLGNAVVPQIPELIGRAILDVLETTHA